MSVAVTDQWLEQVFAGGQADEEVLGPATLQLVVGGPKESPLSVIVRLTGQGVTASLGSTKVADLTLTTSWGDFDQLLDGSLDPSVAYMRGRLKTAGSSRVLLRVLQWAATPSFEKGRRRARALQ